MTSLEDYRDTLNAKAADYALALRSLETEAAEETRLSDLLTAASTAQTVLQQVAQQVQQEAHARVSSIVSRCLSAVFQEPYEFQILFERKRGRTEAQLVFVRNGQTVDPMTAAGGGVVDVAAFALRLAALALARPCARPILIMDEPFRFVSVDYRDRVRELLQTLSQEMGIQLILVTHQEEIVCGKVVRI